MFTGSIVAIITPMDEEGRICWPSFKKLIDYHVQNGTSAILLIGTTGESATLSYSERDAIVMTILELADGRIPVIVGTGSNSTAEAIHLTERVNGSGVAACLSVTPYYNRPTQEGLFQHFKVIAEHTDLPQILYNVPIRTSCDMLPETVIRLSEVKNIIGIKEATGNLARIQEIKKMVSDNFILLSGHDPSALDFMKFGGDGVISITANTAARDMAEMCKLVIEGNFDKAYIINQRLIELHNALLIEPNPIPVKWACKELSLIENDTLRLPMTPITKDSRLIVSLALRSAGLL